VRVLYSVQQTRIFISYIICPTGKVCTRISVMKGQVPVRLHSVTEATHDQESPHRVSEQVTVALRRNSMCSFYDILEQGA
jgi:hypothetical protein